jgi:hypothetical protein
MAIGDLPDVKSGHPFTSRQALYDAGVHRALQAGIVGSGAAGAESAAMPTMKTTEMSSSTRDMAAVIPIPVGRPPIKRSPARIRLW